MKRRTPLSKRELLLRRRLCKVLEEAERMVHGSIIRMARTCGNPNCKCATQGEKHLSLYVGQTRKGKTRMKYIGKAREGRVKRWVRNYKEASELLERISEEGWRALDARDG